MSNRRDPARNGAAPHYPRAVAAAISEDDGKRAAVFRLTFAQSILDSLLLGLVLYFFLPISSGSAAIHLNSSVTPRDRIVVTGVAALAMTVLLTMVGLAKTSRVSPRFEAGIIASSVTLSMMVAAIAGVRFFHFGLIAASPQFAAGGLVAIMAIMLERSLLASVISSNRPGLRASRRSTTSAHAWRPVGVTTPLSRAGRPPSEPASSRIDHTIDHTPLERWSSGRFDRISITDKPATLIDVAPDSYSTLRATQIGADPRVVEMPLDRSNVEQGLNELLRISTDFEWPRRSSQSVTRSVKRLIDLTVSLAALSVLSPLMLGLAILVKLESRGPALFVQTRVGQDGKTFNLLKFRSMRVDAETCTGPIFAKPNDPRCTRIGRFMRRHSLDELPQLINVLRGEMSIVGPRPERPYFVARFSQTIPQYVERHREKAGITGWAQVNGRRGDTSIEERIEYDLYYVENWSLAFDLKIMVRTIVEILQGHNAY